MSQQKAAPKEISVPVIDLRDFTAGSPVTRQRFISEMGGALENTGFFSIVNHGVNADLIEAAYGQCREFFSLPSEVKALYDLNNRSQRGFTGMGKERAKDNKNAAASDLKEFWHLGQELAATHPLYSQYLKNVWPSETPAFKKVMVEFFYQMNACAMHLLDATSLYIGESKGFLRAVCEDGNSILRLLNYPPIPEDAHPASIRAGAHEDINLITLLPAATGPGLELLRRDGSWMPINSKKGEIIVDAADMLQNLTNGLLKSTTHRVVNPDNSREQRFSMPFFVTPKDDTNLTPLPSCLAKTGGVAKFPSLTASQYLTQRLIEIGLAKK